MPGSKFDTANLSFDQRIGSGTFFGVETEWLHSDGDRTIGMTTGVLPTPFPGAVSSTRQKIEFRERNISAYAAQLFGDGFSVGARYRLSEAQLETRLPELPNSTTDLNLAEQSECSLLHQVSLLLNYQHTCGFFSQWESLWYYQDNSGYTPVRPGDDFLQHNV